MNPLLVLLRPSANRVYAAEATGLAAAELAVLLGIDEVATTTLAGVDYLQVEPHPPVDAALGRLSAFFAAYRHRPDGALEPHPVARPDRLEDDLVGIPKYPGKTNEQFTRLLLNVTTAAVTIPVRSVLDPMCGRGTTLSTAITLGVPAYGVEADERSVEAYATFLRTYLRRKRLKHTVEVTPLRRDGRRLGSRLTVTVGDRRDPDATELQVLTGDARESASLWGKRRFDAIVTDAPYGVVHGAHTDRKARSAADLLAEAVPVWAGQLTAGGALGISWNTHHLSREELRAILTDAGLRPRTGGPWERFGHRVDASVHRDLVVATS